LSPGAEPEERKGDPNDNRQIDHYIEPDRRDP
jgi:hypothetical protein